MENGEHLSLEQVQAFLTGDEEVGFKASGPKELYEWTQRTLCAQGYTSLPRSGKGLMQRYIGKVTPIRDPFRSMKLSPLARKMSATSRTGRFITAASCESASAYRGP